MLTMKRGTFKVSINSLDPDANSLRTGFVSQYFGINGNARSGWSVTHLASGRQCASGASRAYANRIVEDLTDLPIDWTLADPLAGSSPKVIGWVRDIATRKQLRP